jgi:hypothetical protein
LQDVIALGGILSLQSWTLSTLAPSKMTGPEMANFMRTVWVIGHIMRTMKLGLLLGRFAGLVITLLNNVRNSGNI